MTKGLELCVIFDFNYVSVINGRSTVLLPYHGDNGLIIQVSTDTGKHRNRFLSSWESENFVEINQEILSGSWEN